MNRVSLLHDAIQNVAVVLAPYRKQLKNDKKFIETLLHIFSGIEDFRQQIKVVYKLENILTICLYIAMKGEFHSFLYAEKYVKIKADEFRAMKLVEGNKLPSHDTFLRIFSNIDANELRDVMLKRIDKLIAKIAAYAPPEMQGGVRLVNGDGKYFNGSGRKNGKKNVNVFNFYDASSAVCLTSVPLDDKESEIPAFQKILQKYKLKNTMVTADALHCQLKTMETIIRRQGQYTLTVKDNQSGKLKHVIDVMDRNCMKCHGFSFNECDYEIFIIDYKPTEEDFPYAKAYVRMVSHKRAGQPDYNPKPQYFVSSSDNPQLIMETIDNRWQVEDGLHLEKDKFLQEDKCTFMNKNAIKVMATINNIVYALYRLATAMFGYSSMSETKIRFKDCPEQMLAKLIPLMVGQNLTMLVKQNMRGYRKPRTSC